MTSNPMTADHIPDASKMVATALPETLLDRLRRRAEFTGDALLIGAVAEIDRLRAESERDRADAARWRHLPLTQVEHLCDHFYLHTFTECSEETIRETLSDFIDAAIPPPPQSEEWT